MSNRQSRSVYQRQRETLARIERALAHLRHLCASVERNASIDPAALVLEYTSLRASGRNREQALRDLGRQHERTPRRIAQILKAEQDLASERGKLP